MKHSTTLGRTQRCPFYGSLQHLLSPSAADDLTPPPQAASSAKVQIPLSVPGFGLAIFRGAENLPAEWDGLLPEGTLVLSRAYLRLFEQHPPEGMGFAYLAFYKGHQLAGLAVCQLMEFRALRQIQSLQQPARGSLGVRVAHLLKRSVARRINARLIVCGLTQFSGEFAYSFDARLASPENQASLAAEAVELLARQLREEGWNPSGILAKDFYPESLPHLKPLADSGYTPCVFQPNMILDIRPGWLSFGDYLEAMSSKYRVRARRAFKKRNPLRSEELDAEGVRLHLGSMHKLYLEMASQADFNLLQLPAAYFLAMKEAFPEQFRVLAYFHGDRLAGFCTTLRNGRELEAHFIGFGQEENREHQLYLNMLYDMVRLAIEEERVERLVFSRTAMEIKSSVGAEPRDMYCYLRHLYEPANRLAPVLVRQLQPRVEWRQRHPFSQQED